MTKKWQNQLKIWQILIKINQLNKVFHLIEEKNCQPYFFKENNNKKNYKKIAILK